VLETYDNWSLTVFLSFDRRKGAQHKTY
jgi:hypothetical protein